MMIAATPISASEPPSSSLQDTSEMLALVGRGEKIISRVFDALECFPELRKLNDIKILMDETQRATRTLRDLAGIRKLIAILALPPTSPPGSAGVPPAKTTNEPDPGPWTPSNAPDPFLGTPGSSLASPSFGPPSSSLASPDPLPGTPGSSLASPEPLTPSKATSLRPLAPLRPLTLSKALSFRLPPTTAPQSLDPAQSKSPSSNSPRLSATVVEIPNHPNIPTPRTPNIRGEIDRHIAATTKIINELATALNLTPEDLDRDFETDLDNDLDDDFDVDLTEMSHPSSTSFTSLAPSSPPSRLIPPSAPSRETPPNSTDSS